MEMTPAEQVYAEAPVGLQAPPTSTAPAMGRAGRIVDIIERRHPLVARIDAAIDALTEFDRSLEKLGRGRDYLAGVVGEPAVVANLQRLDIDGVRGRARVEAANLARLRGRFGRATINLGVVGLARQGKSRLLQSLSGLSTNEIPDGRGGHCTGARSVIVHDAAGSRHADVIFHTEDSFLSEVIAPYYRELNLGTAPRTVAEFARTPVPPLPGGDADEPEGGYAGPGAKYEHLQRYHDHFAYYGDLLGQPVRRIAIDDVRTYVAQDTPDGQRTLYNYLAVDHVQVSCPFPADDIAQLALIDMPGLGDTGIGDEERVIETLGQEVDAILFVKMPPPTGAIWSSQDVHLYDMAQRALVELPIDLWSFMVLNRTRQGSVAGDNEENCRRQRDEISTQHIRVSRVLIADCSEPGAVREEVLDPVLNHLLANIQALDQRYASSCQGRVARVQAEAAGLLRDAEAALGHSGAVEGELLRFDELFAETWLAVTNGLEVMLAELRDWSLKPNQRLADQLDVSLQKCRDDSGIPSVEEIENAAKLHGSYSTAFNEYLHKVRTHLVAHFAPVEDTLRLSLEDVRDKVAAVLKGSGRLGALVDADGTAFIRGVGDMMGDAPDLRSAFTTLADVELTYRGFLQYRMRPVVMNLHPDGPRGEAQIRPEFSGAGVREALEVLHERVIYGLDTAFEDWLSEPNQVAEAIVEEFVDRVLRSESAPKQWRGFYLANRGLIWREEFDRIGERSRLRQDWDQLVRAAHAAALQNFGIVG
jgi:hypothetical protein